MAQTSERGTAKPVPGPITSRPSTKMSIPQPGLELDKKFNIIKAL